MLQRINEITEIDSRYITCSEYQLFINEKLQVGEYRQPLHWTSYRFLPEEAQKPITGVRADDAEQFCVWLTQKYSSLGFRYRLPTKSEVNRYPAENQKIGCWSRDGEEKVVSGINPDSIQNWQHFLIQEFHKKIPIANSFFCNIALARALDIESLIEEKKDLINIKNILEFAMNLEYIPGVSCSLLADDFNKIIPYETINSFYEKNISHFLSCDIVPDLFHSLDYISILLTDICRGLSFPLKSAHALGFLTETSHPLSLIRALSNDLCHDLVSSFLFVPEALSGGNPIISDSSQVEFITITNPKCNPDLCYIYLLIIYVLFDLSIGIFEANKTTVNTDKIILDPLTLPKRRPFRYNYIRCISGLFIFIPLFNRPQWRNFRYRRRILLPFKHSSSLADSIAYDLAYNRTAVEFVENVLNYSKHLERTFASNTLGGKRFIKIAVFLVKLSVNILLLLAYIIASFLWLFIFVIFYLIYVFYDELIFFVRMRNFKTSRRKIMTSYNDIIKNHYNLIENFKFKRNFSFNYLFFLLIVNERKKNRLAAWEGIRIVRERIDD